MSTITISELRPAGSELFSDSENYLSELTSDELSLIYGEGGLREVIQTAIAGYENSFVGTAISGAVVSGISGGIVGSPVSATGGVTAGVYYGGTIGAAASAVIGALYGAFW